MSLAAAGLCTAAMAGPVNINSADAATLARELKGVGESKAAAIVDYRLKHGPFKSADELAQVKGIGQKLIDRNRADIRIDKVAVVARPAAAATAGTASRK
jgi:competence protein ComEA